MRIITILFCCMLLGGFSTQAQVYVDHFDNNNPAQMGGAAGFTFAEANSELTVTATNTGDWDVFTYQLHDTASGNPVTVDVSGNNKLFVRAKASTIGTSLRIDLEDVGGFSTSQGNVTKTLTNQFTILEFDFTGNYVDGGFGGTSCAAGPCPVDSSQIKALVMYADPGAMFSGSIVIDYVAFGKAPDSVITSTVFQDHFTDPSSPNAVTYLGIGYTASQQGTTLEIVGDGTTPPWDPLTYIFMNHTTMDTFDIDITGNNKMYVKVKSTVPNTTLRIDVQDIIGYASTQASISKLVDTAFTVLEYDFTGVLADLGYGGTPCDTLTAPCPVDGTRIADLLLFIEPGVGAYTGTLSIDYISFGNSLEPAGPTAQLTYEDHFGNETLEFSTADPGFMLNEIGSELIISGDGSGSPYASISYLLHEKDSGNQVFVNMGPAQDKVFIRAKTDMGSVPLRVDLLDTAGYVTSIASLTKTLSDQYQVFEYNYNGGYTDGGFGGSPCMMGPCPVDPGAIAQVLFYIDPVQGGYSGTVSIDYISFGRPLGDDPGPKGIINYNDDMDDNTMVFVTDPAGLVSSFANSEWTITGDGTGGMWGSVIYAKHNDMGLNILADAAGSMDKLYIRAKASVDNTELRIDVQDNLTYVSNLNAISTNLTTTYQIYTLDFANSYEDGAFGGSPCMVSGCPVDPERIENLQLFIDPGVGAYNGTVTIDWISWGMQLNVGIQDLERIQALTVFPNPTRDETRIMYSLQQAAQVEVRLTNLVGQEVLRIGETQVAGENTVDLSLQGLPAGTYFLQVITDGHMVGTLPIQKN